MLSMMVRTHELTLRALDSSSGSAKGHVIAHRRK